MNGYQTSDTCDLYMNSENADATLGDKLNAAPLDFRNVTVDDLNKILALAGSTVLGSTMEFGSMTSTISLEVIYLIHWRI